MGTEELKLGVKKNRVIDNLDDLDREFCQTWDKLLSLYKRIMIRAYDIKDGKSGQFDKKVPHADTSRWEIIEKP